MNTLTPLECGIVGAADAVDALVRKRAAKILLISDTHGHYPLFQRIVLKYGQECDALLFAGDGMWDIVRYLENAHEDERYRVALPPVLAFVAGNGDGERFFVSPGRKERDKVSGGPEAERSGVYPLEVPQTQILTICGHRIFLCHGNRYSVDIGVEVLGTVAKVSGCDIAVFGHTHIPVAETVSNVLAINPGSPARPRGYSSPGFALLQLEAGKKVPVVQFQKI